MSLLINNNMDNIYLSEKEAEKYTYPKKKKGHTWTYVTLAILYSYWVIVGLYFILVY